MKPSSPDDIQLHFFKEIQKKSLKCAVIFENSQKMGRSHARQPNAIPTFKKKPNQLQTENYRLCSATAVPGIILEEVGG